MDEDKKSETPETAQEPGKTKAEAASKDADAKTGEAASTTDAKDAAQPSPQTGASDTTEKNEDGTAPKADPEGADKGTAAPADSQDTESTPDTAPQDKDTENQAADATETAGKTNWPFQSPSDTSGTASSEEASEDDTIETRAPDPADPEQASPAAPQKERPQAFDPAAFAAAFEAGAKADAEKVRTRAKRRPGPRPKAAPKLKPLSELSPAMRWTGIAAAAVLGLLLVFAAITYLVLPGTIRLERSVVIDRPPATLFALANNFKKFNAWSPWKERDPDARYTFEGPAEGLGARMAWQSDQDDVGSGAQEIVRSTPHEEVRYALTFGEEGEWGTANAKLHFAPEENSTRVTWTFESALGLNPIARFMGGAIKGAVGKDYEAGLARLKTYAESFPQADFGDLDATVTDAPPLPIAFVSDRAPSDGPAIEAAFGRAFAAINAYMGEAGLAMASAPIAIATSYTADDYAFDAAIPVSGRPAVPPQPPVRLGYTPGGRVLKVVHKGSYSDLPATYEKIDAYMAVHGLERRDRSWEHYISDPTTVADQDIITHIYVPVN